MSKHAKQKFTTRSGDKIPDGWPVLWLGQDNEGKHWTVELMGTPSSELYQFLTGAKEDAELIAHLLNTHFGFDG